MTLTLEIPDDIAAQLAQAGKDMSRAALEAIAIEGYRSGALTQVYVGQLLELPRLEAEDFLARHTDLYDYDPAELKREADALLKLSDSH